MAIISEILRFILPRSSIKASAFQALRRQVTERGSVKIQYFGYVMPNEGFPRPKEDQMCWYIEWPETSNFRTSTEFKIELEKFAEGCPRSLLFNFRQTKDGEVIKALESPACEFAIINLAPNAPRFTNGFEQSMHKTFTDCYLAPGGGLTGGGWGYALNSNDSDGEEVRVANGTGKMLDEDKRMLAYYVLGWESIEMHHAYEHTELFNVEIDKLKPYFGPGTGALYVNFERDI